jgi:predicted small lipoprotein YifL
MPLRLPFARAALIGGVIILSQSACGRRGALEPPPDASAPQAQESAAPASGEAAPGTLPSPVGTPKSGTKQGFTIPKEPFILDPLL